MAEPQFQHLACQAESGVMVATLLDAQIQGEKLVEGLRRELLEAAQLFPLKKWVIDCHNCVFFSTAALRPLLSLHHKLQGEGGRILLCNLTRQLAEVFQVTHLAGKDRSATTPFELAADLADALRRLKHHTREVIDGVLVFTMVDEELHGDDLAEELWEELQTCLRESQAGHVVLDYRHVRAITTSCIRPILQLRTQLKDRGGRVVFANLSEQVAEILTVTRLVSPHAGAQGLFEFYPDNETAVRSLCQRGN